MVTHTEAACAAPCVGAAGANMDVRGPSHYKHQNRRDTRTAGLKQYLRRISGTTDGQRHHFNQHALLIGLSISLPCGCLPSISHTCPHTFPHTFPDQEAHALSRGVTSGRSGGRPSSRAARGGTPDVRSHHSVTAALFIPHTQLLVTSGSGNTCVKFWDLRHAGSSPVGALTLGAAASQAGEEQGGQAGQLPTLASAPTPAPAPRGTPGLAPAGAGAGAGHATQHTPGPMQTPTPGSRPRAAGTATGAASTPRTGPGLRQGGGVGPSVVGYAEQGSYLVTSAYCRQGAAFGVTCMAVSPEGEGTHEGGRPRRGNTAWGVS